MQTESIDRGTSPNHAQMRAYVVFQLLHNYRMHVMRFFVTLKSREEQNNNYTNSNR